MFRQPPSRPQKSYSLLCISNSVRITTRPSGPDVFCRHHDSSRLCSESSIQSRTVQPVPILPPACMRARVCAPRRETCLVDVCEELMCVRLRDLRERMTFQRLLLHAYLGFCALPGWKTHSSGHALAARQKCEASRMNGGISVRACVCLFACPTRKDNPRLRVKAVCRRPYWIAINNCWWHIRDLAHCRVVLGQRLGAQVGGQQLRVYLC